jgi:hypothetical protein
MITCLLERYFAPSSMAAKLVSPSLDLGGLRHVQRRNIQV